MVSLLDRFWEGGLGEGRDEMGLKGGYGLVDVGGKRAKGEGKDGGIMELRVHIVYMIVYHRFILFYSL